eukprot:TRINITY_DN5798_c0_g1_i1.p1 TRINITY_DN5798_c0_g1~~TRINITY_DN5798_c0_g1_i1.p1  ORF type:complete len:299 (-),score=82.72 TRINITY_DN5798_c0_g1_i1:106-942(-)
MRGCHFACRYCQTAHLHGGRVRYRSVAAVERVVAHYASRYPTPVDIRFVSPNSLGYRSVDDKTPNVAALWELTRMIKRYPANMFLGSFPSEVRPDFVTPETVEILKQSATTIVAVGGQSGSDDVLARMHRCHTVSTISAACQLLLAGGLTPQVDFILGTPGETEAEQWATLSLVSTLLTWGCHVRLHYFMPLPGTPWASSTPAVLAAGVVSEAGRLLRCAHVDGPFAHQMVVSGALSTKAATPQAPLPPPTPPPPSATQTQHQDTREAAAAPPSSNPL